MSFRDDCKLWSNPDGTMSNVFPPVKTDNPYTFTSTKFFIGKCLLGLDMTEDKSEFHDYILRHQIEPGLYDQEVSWSQRTLSHDEINAIVAFSYIFALSIYLYGKRHFWTYINRPKSEIIAPAYIPVVIPEEGSRKEKLKAWIWSKLKKPVLLCYLPIREVAKQNILKMGYLVPAIMANAEEETPSLLLQAWYCWDIKQASKKPWGDTSTKLLFIMQGRYKHLFPPRMRKAYDEFLQAMQEMYGDYGTLYGIYFGKNHPFATHTKGIRFV